MNIEELKNDYTKAVKTFEEIKSQYKELSRVKETADKQANAYHEQLKAQLKKEGYNLLEIYKIEHTDNKYQELLKVANTFDTKPLKIAVNLAYENIARAVHNIMLYEAQNNLDKLAKYPIGYKRFAKCFTIGSMTQNGFYRYGNIELPYVFQNQYQDFERYATCDNEIQIDRIKEYKPYQIFTAVEILKDVKAAADYRKQLTKKLDALRAEIEAENNKRKFYSLEISSPNYLSISSIDRR